MKLRRRVVVVGGGFGGLSVTKALRRAPVHVTLVDRSNHFLFQPLLYQVAMAGLAPAEIAAPIRSLLRNQDNVQVLLAEVADIDFQSRCVHTRECPPIEYDYLVLAPGASTHYFGHAQWAQLAPGLKDLDDAVEVRRRVLLAFEAAEREADPLIRRRHLTFVVVGGGPTGVELAGAIAELATYVLSRDFRSIRPDATRVLLLEGGDRILSSFEPILSERAQASLQDMGVEVIVGKQVTSIDREGVFIGQLRIEATTVLWAAGVRASPLGETLKLTTDHQSRVAVEADCSVPGQPRVYVIGDAARFVAAGDSQPLPGTSPVAMQQGRFVARQITRDIEGQAREAFHYRDKGIMATIGRSRAVARIGNLRLSGYLAWLAWLGLHIVYLIDFRNRLLVLIDWAWSYFTYQRGSRLITGRRLEAGAAHDATPVPKIATPSPPVHPPVLGPRARRDRHSGKRV
jgi:NADH dehydrogenase